MSPSMTGQHKHRILTRLLIALMLLALTFTTAFAGETAAAATESAPAVQTGIIKKDAKTIYIADENGDITSAVNKNPVSLASFYGEWTYGENEDGKFVIDENGFALDGGKAIPIAYNELGKLVIGDMNNVTEYSTGLGLERLYDNTNGLELTGENYVLAVSYTGSDEKDRPNLADAMDDWHADYGYDELYFSLNAKTPLN